MYLWIVWLWIIGNINRPDAHVDDIIVLCISQYMIFDVEYRGFLTSYVMIDWYFLVCKELADGDNDMDEIWL